MRLRAGGAADVPAILALFDEAVRWMVSRGNTQQWGTRPWSADPARVERVHKLVGDSHLVVAEVDGQAVGVLGTSPFPHAYIHPVAEPELYIALLLTSRRHAGRGIGAQLLANALEQARARGVGLVRVDCYAGGSGDLIRYYERNGFVRTHPFMVGDWPGQLLEQRV